MTTSAGRVLQHLEELHSLETQLVATLTTHIAATPRSEYRDLLERHRYETRTQAQYLEQRLTELGRSRSLLQVLSVAARDVVGQGVALVLAPVSLLREAGGQEQLLANAKAEAASEALEIVSYRALEAVAAAAGDARTAELAREHRAQEEAFLDDLLALVGRLATRGADATADDDAAPRRATGRAAPTSVPVAAQRGAATAIAGYDELTADQVLRKLKPLSASELAAVDGYERGGRHRKRILDRVAVLRAKTVDEQLTKI